MNYINILSLINVKHELNNNFFNRIISGSRFIKDTPGSKIDSRIKVINNHIYSKNKGDAFSNPKLDSFLKQKGINKIFIVGLDASACVYKTSIGAISRGYKVVVLKDAVVTLNMSKIPNILDKYVKQGILLTSIKEFQQLD